MLAAKNAKQKIQVFGKSRAKAPRRKVFAWCALRTGWPRNISRKYRQGRKGKNKSVPNLAYFACLARESSFRVDKSKVNYAATHG